MITIDKLKVHYAPLELFGDIPLKIFDNFGEHLGQDKFNHWFFVNFSRQDDTIVWVVALEDEVFVTSSFKALHEFCFRMLDCYNPYLCQEPELFIQEYSSYEEAYKIALAMKEPNKLCYED